MNRGAIDPRAWLVWAAAMSLPAMLGRNPFPLVACLVVVLAVRSGTRENRTSDWDRLIRLALLFAGISVLFNLITYHGGDRIVAEIPGWIPIAGGPLTLNAVVYGILSGLAIVTLVLTWSTVAERLRWSELIRLAPPGLAGLAVSSSIAITLVPKTIESFSAVREAQAIRGHRVRGARDLVPLAAPLLTLGLERAVTMSEALESRGFGGPETGAERGRWVSLAIVAALTTLASAAFLLASGREIAGLAALALALLTALSVGRSTRKRQTWRPTRYRPVVFAKTDWVVAGTAALSATLLLVINRLDREALFYEPYPAIDWPAVSLPALAAIALLLTPLAVAPSAGSGEA